MATVIKTQSGSYTESEFRRIVRRGFSRPLPEGPLAEAEIERIIRAKDVLESSVAVARRIALDERAKITRN